MIYKNQRLLKIIFEISSFNILIIIINFNKKQNENMRKEKDIEELN